MDKLSDNDGEFGSERNKVYFLILIRCIVTEHTHVKTHSLSLPVDTLEHGCAGQPLNLGLNSLVC